MAVTYSRAQLLALSSQPCCRLPPPSLLSWSRGLAFPALLHAREVEDTEDLVTKADVLKLLKYPSSEEDVNVVDEMTSTSPALLCPVERGPEDLAARLEELLDLVAIDEAQLGSMEELVERIRRVLAPSFPSAAAEVYGSVGSGLGMLGCDLDMHVELGAAREGGEVEGREAAEKVEELFLFHFSGNFRTARAVTAASVPIVRVKDKLTGIRCDINPANRMGVFNTKYIRFCCEFDPRVRKLLMIVKIFCSRHGISDSGRGDHFNNYTLVVMAIVYLQTQGVLHPLHQLQQGLQPLRIDGHNFAFCPGASRLPSLRPNISTLVDLLEGFMDYMAYFPFSTHALSPMAGREVAIASLRTGTNLPPCLAAREVRGLVDRPCALVIQDPFELNRNLGQAVSSGRLAKMVEAFARCSRLLLVVLEGGGTQEQLFTMMFEPGFSSFLLEFGSGEEDSSAEG